MAEQSSKQEKEGRTKALEQKHVFFFTAGIKIICGGGERGGGDILGGTGKHPGCMGKLACETDSGAGILRQASLFCPSFHISLLLSSDTDI